MAGQIRGIEIAINADTTGATRGLRDLTNQSVQVSRNLNTVNSLLRLDPHNTQLVAQQQQLLAGAIGTAREKLNQLRAAQDDVNAAFQRGDINEEQYLAFQSEIVRTEQRLAELESQTEDTGEAMEKGSEKSHKFGEALGKGLKVGAELAVKAVKEVGKAIVGIGKQAIEGAAELEQNLGGSQAVFQNYALIMQQTAEKAYKNMGLSQSEYLATANKMGALFQGTGLTVKESADLTRTAMQRAADMASVMGIDLSAAMESVAGAAKGNFTMMDNLGVAINDTTLKAYAEAKGLGELKTTQDKVTAAMSLFLEQTEKYDGNFAREAEETISGSLGLLKSSWDNLVTGLGSGKGDIMKMTESVTDALMSVITNLKPVIERIAKSLPKVVAGALKGLREIIPSVIPELVNLAVESLPSIFGLGYAIINSLGDAIMQNLPMLIDSAVEIILQINQGLIENLPTLIPAVAQMIVLLGNALADNAGLIFDSSGELIAALVDGLIQAVPILWEGAKEIVKKLHSAIVERGVLTIEAGVELAKNIGEGIKSMFHTISVVGGDLIYKFVEGIKSLWGEIKNAASEMVNNFRDAIKSRISEFVGYGKDMMQGFIDGILSKVGAVKDAVLGVADTIKSYLHFSVPDVGPLTTYESWMPDFMQGLAKGIDNNIGLVQASMQRASSALAVSAREGIAALSAAQQSMSGLSGGYSNTSNSNSVTNNISVNVTASVSNDYDIHRLAESLGSEIGQVLSKETTHNALQKGFWAL